MANDNLDHLNLNSNVSNNNESFDTKSKTEIKILNNTNSCDSEEKSTEILNEENKIKTDIDTDRISNKRKVIISENTDDKNVDVYGNNDKTDEFHSSPKKPKLSSREIVHKFNSSPKKRLDLPTSSSSSNVKANKHENQFIYGNYSRYYGYRYSENFQDIRLNIFSEHKNLFENKEILDIGCNAGLITISIAKQFNIKSIIGFDIDKNLINRAKNFIRNQQKNFRKDNKMDKDDNIITNLDIYPFNINFYSGNYVLRDDVLLEIEKQKFDLILCLSVTKWIHLNFGDNGLKQAFRRMYKQLRPGGILILEPQAFDNYKRRKKLTPNIFKNFQSIQFFPKDFNDYLLGPEVGFNEMYELGIPDHCHKGFRRPIYVYVKGDNM